MFEIWQNFHFLRPWMLLFLLIPFGLYFKNLTFSNSSSSWENVCDKKLLNFLLVTDKSLRKISIKKFVYLGLITTILAAAGPAWKKIEIPTFEIENPTLFVLSLAQDMQLKDVTPSRLDRAKFMISDIADNIPNGQFGLEVYSQEPYIITPLTDDAKIIKSLLPQIVTNIVPDNGDRLDRAIALALDRFKAAGYTSGNIVIFASDVGQRFDFALEKVKSASALNYAIHFVDTSYSGNEKLQMLAEKGHGIYLRVKENNLQKLLNILQQTDEEKIKLSKNLRSNYLDYGYYLVFISLLCMLPFFRRGLLSFIFSFCFVSNAYAGFLLNNDQEALKLFQDGQFEQASSKFSDNIWRGVALYKAEKNEEALKEFSYDENSDIALYNKGVVLTRLCQYEKALEAFSKTLKINPNNEDAIYNKRVLEDLFIKAKDDPNILSCQNNQKQNNKQKQNQDNQQQQDNNNKQTSANNDENQQNKENTDNENQQQDEQKNDKNNQEQQSQDRQKQENQQQQNSSNNQEDQQNQENAGDENQNKENQEQNKNGESASQTNQPQNNDDANSSSQQKTSDQPDENNNTPTNADNDNGEESKSHNEEGEDNNANEEQIEDRDVGLMNAKQGDDDTQYDEEALAMQRRYREIPEDVGGLLREFIKKDYLRGRYKDEN